MELIYIPALLVLVINCCGCRPQGDSKDAQILQFKNNNDGVTGYNFYYETSNNIRRQESGQILNPESENSILVVEGSYSYVGPDGQTHEVEFVADENGFRPHVTNSKPPSLTTRQEISGFASSAAITSLAGGGLGR